MESYANGASYDDVAWLAAREVYALINKDAPYPAGVEPLGRFGDYQTLIQELRDLHGNAQRIWEKGELCDPWEDSALLWEGMRRMTGQATNYAPLDPLVRAIGGGASSPPLAASPVKKLRDLMQRTFAPTRWAIHGLLPEGAILLASKPKMGKSTMALGIGLSVAVGGMALGKLPCEQGAVLYLDLENGERRLQDRTDDLLLDTECPDDFYYADTWPTFEQGGLALIDEWIAATPSARLVIVDTLKKVRPLALANQSIYDYDYMALDSLHQLAVKHAITILIIHHSRKADASDFIEAASGSNGLTGAADGIMVLRRARGEIDGELHITGRDVEDTKVALRYTYPQWIYLGDSERYTLTKERQVIIEAIRLAGRPLSPNEVATAIDKPRTTVKVTMNRMNGNGLRTTGDGRYTLDGGGVPSNNNNNESRRDTPASVQEVLPVLPELPVLPVLPSYQEEDTVTGNTPVTDEEGQQNAVNGPDRAVGDSGIRGNTGNTVTPNEQTANAKGTLPNGVPAGYEPSINTRPMYDRLIKAAKERREQSE